MSEAEPKEPGETPAPEKVVAKPEPAPEKPKPKPEPKPEPEPKPAPKPVKHLAIGAKTTATSTSREWPGEGPTTALVDGDLATRWASEPKDGQEVVLVLAKPLPLKRIRIHWETASAKTYVVSVSADGKMWSVAQKLKDGKRGPRADDIKLDGKPVQQIKLELKDRATEYGFSILEIEAK